jgi:putative ABC transport system permease protein
MNNLRLALRSFGKTPGFTALAVVVLGLGLGVNATLFTLVRALLLAPPSGVAEPGRLVRITRVTDYGSRSGSWAYPDYAFYRDENRTFAGIAALGGGGVVLANTGTAAAEARIAFVSGNYFAVLGIPFAAGRPFGADEDLTPGAAPFAVVSSGFWRSHLGADPRAMGSTITLNGHAFTVVGVTADAFRGIDPADGVPDVWTPIMMKPVLQPSEGGDPFHRVPHETENWIQAIGRLRPGVAVAAARADLTDLWQRLNATFPEWKRGVGVFVTGHFGFAPYVRDRIASTTRLLMAAALAVLLVACANLALLLLARATTRRKEIGVRLALGASRSQVMARLLVETVLLAVGGGALGVLLAAWSANLAALLLPVHPSGSVRPDWMVLGFTALLALATALACGIAPAWMVSRTGVAEDLKGGAPGSGRSLMRSGLVVAQVTLSLALVAGAGLFVRSLLAAQRVDLGFATENRLLVTVSLQDYGYTDETGPAFIGRTMERLEAIPGVQSATTTAMVALGGGMWTSDFVPDGIALPEGQAAVDAPTNAVGPGYFRTMGIPLVAGRDFTARDDRTAVPVVIVNETLARQVWGTESPLGRTIARDRDHFTVIGVARDAKYYELGESAEPQLYFAELQLYRPQVTFVVHGTGEGAALAPDVRRAIHQQDPDLAITSVRAHGDVRSDAAGPYRVTASLISLFGVLALLLAGVGLYGVLSYVVVQGTREIAVRMALGAEARQVAARVMRRGLMLTGLGIVAGLLIVWPVSRLARQFLFGVRPGDPVTLAVAAAVLFAVAAAASVIPARRAARIDPMEALRYE